MKNLRYGVIGGDLRSTKLANLIFEDGYRVSTYGFENINFYPGVEESSSLEFVIANSDILIGPVPCSVDKKTINSPFYTDKIQISDIFKKMSRTQIFIAGRITDEIKDMANFYDVLVYDILEREEISVLNAIPTAEGAIQIAMEKIPITLHGSQSLVIGFGRIGKVLSKMLLGIGANVHVAARKHSDMAWIKSYGYTGIAMKTELPNYLNYMDVIFNTAPNMVLDSNLMQNLNKDCLIIDLASNPGGVDFEAAEKMGIKTIWALSLPGKVAPLSSAKFIKDTIYNIVNE